MPYTQNVTKQQRLRSCCNVKKENIAIKRTEWKQD